VTVAPLSPSVHTRPYYDRSVQSIEGLNNSQRPESLYGEEYLNEIDRAWNDNLSPLLRAQSLHHANLTSDEGHYPDSERQGDEGRHANEYSDKESPDCEHHDIQSQDGSEDSSEFSEGPTQWYEDLNNLYIQSPPLYPQYTSEEYPPVWYPQSSWGVDWATRQGLTFSEPREMLSLSRWNEESGNNAFTLMGDYEYGFSSPISGHPSEYNPSVDEHQPPWAPLSPALVPLSPPGTFQPIDLDSFRNSEKVSAIEFREGNEICYGVVSGRICLIQGIYMMNLLT
jgi:hypothetical protein